MLGLSLARRKAFFVSVFVFTPGSFELTTIYRDYYDAVYPQNSERMLLISV